MGLVSQGREIPILFDVANATWPQTPVRSGGRILDEID